MRILFLSKRNAARSQIAEALLRRLSRGHASVVSAGTTPAVRVDPLAREALRRLAGGRLTGHRPKYVDEVAGEPFSAVVALDEAAEECRRLFPNAQWERWKFDDPSISLEPRGDRQADYDKVARALLKRLREWWQVNRPMAGVRSPKVTGTRSRLPSPPVAWRTVPPSDAPALVFVYLGPPRRCVNMCAYLSRSGFHVLCGETFSRRPDKLRMRPDAVIVRADGRHVPGTVRKEFRTLAALRARLSDTPMIMVLDRLASDQELRLVRNANATTVLLRNNDQLLRELTQVLNRQRN